MLTIRSISIPRVLKTVKVLTLGKSLRSFSLNLWDEKQKKLVSFRSLKEPAAG